MQKRKYNRGFFILIMILPLSWWACEQAAPPELEIIWQDEFNGATLDNSKWVHEIGTGNWGWGNGELQYYRSENTIVSNGTAKIIARKENYIGSSYTSSRIKTDGKFTFKYGKVQARIKTVNGQGFWPAFWMLPSGGSWPCDGEIDIMEQWASDGNSNVTNGAAHVGTCPYSQSNHVYQSFHHNNFESYANDFHIYEIRWDRNYIAWYVDDVRIFEVTPDMYSSSYEWPFNSKEWYLILNLAITNSGPNSNTVFPSQIEIDWVRVYQ